MNKIILLIPTIASLSIISPAQMITDIDGNEYNTVTIGDQIWIKENLKVTRYSNGDTIPNITDQGQWDTLTNGAYSDYANNIGIVDTYGRMYNWYTINDSRNIAPTGWHVPSESDWLKLFNYFGGANEASHKLRETGNTHWKGYCGGDNNDLATNESGFTALPGGFRIVGETFEYMGDFGGFWGSTEQSSDNAFYLYLTTCDSYVNTGDVPKAMGLSIRCVCDTLSTVSSENIVNTQIQIFPNPASDIVSIKCTECQNFKLQVFNIVGEIVLQGELNNSKNDFDISFLAKGLYIILFSDSKWSIMTKLIKE